MDRLSCLFKLWGILLLFVFLVIAFIATTLGIAVATLVLAFCVSPNWWWLAVSLIFTISFWIAFYTAFIQN